MSVDELAEELADFWLSALVAAGWEERALILREIHAQLLADMETRAEFDCVSPRFVAALIERLGAPLVACDAQAMIYFTSADERHRDAARIWLQRDAAAEPVVMGFVGEDRRRFPRRFVDAISEIWD